MRPNREYFVFSLVVNLTSLNGDLSLSVIMRPGREYFVFSIGLCEPDGALVGWRVLGDFDGFVKLRKKRILGKYRGQESYENYRCRS
jgi:hypothetical protein